MMASGMEARMQYLEMREDAHTRDIIRLKTENAELQTKVCEFQTKVCELKRENSQTVEKLVEVQSKFQRMETDLKAVFGFRDSIDGRLTSLESNTISAKESEDRLSSLESVMNGLRQDVTNCKAEAGMEKEEENTSSFQQNVEKQLKKVETDVNSCRQEFNSLRQSVTDKMKATEMQAEAGMEKEGKISSSFQQNVEKRLKKVEIDLNSSRQESNNLKQSVTDKMKATEIQVEDRMKKVEKSTNTSQQNIEKRLKKVENDVNNTRQESNRQRQSMTDKIKATEIQSEETQKVVQSLMEVKDGISKSVTHVRLFPKHKPRTSESAKLCKYDFYFNDRVDGYFNGTSWRMEPQIEGNYFIYIKFSQAGEGKIKIFLVYTECNGTEERLIAGITTRDQDTSICLRHFKLKKGQVVWLEMIREEKNADLTLCELTSWLISPSGA